MIGMVINKVAAKCIKGIREMKGIREKSSAIHRWKQGTMSNAVYMNHCKIWESVMAIANELRLNNPLASFLMHWFTNRYKPVNKRTVVVHTLINKWEEQVHPPHTHSQEAIMVQVSSHKDHVMLYSLSVPQGVVLNEFMVYPTCSTKIAGSIESSDGRVVDMYLTIELRAISKWDWHGVEIGIGCGLFKQKMPNECG